MLGMLDVQDPGGLSSAAAVRAPPPRVSDGCRAHSPTGTCRGGGGGGGGGAGGPITGVRGSVTVWTSEVDDEMNRRGDHCCTLPAAEAGAVIWGR